MLYTFIRFPLLSTRQNKQLYYVQMKDTSLDTVTRTWYRLQAQDSRDLAVTSPSRTDPSMRLTDGALEAINADKARVEVWHDLKKNYY